MSQLSIPFTFGDLKRIGDRTQESVDLANAALGPHATVHFSLEVIPGPAAPSTPLQCQLSQALHQPSQALHQPSQPKRRPPRPRRSRPRSGQITPYQAKRAAMQDLAIRRLRRDGFTPYFGEEKRFLMTPPEFTMVLACESVQVSQVIHEVLTQTVGYSDDSGDGRREWVVLSFRHFERRGIMSHSEAKRTLDYAVEQGYLLRRRRGRQQWEYAVHYRQNDIVPR
jgi:hypothetical protein